MQYITAETVRPLYKIWPRFLDEIEISLPAKKVYMDLLDRTFASKNNGIKWIDNDGRVFIRCSIADVCKMIDKKDTAAKACMRELDEVGLIKRRRNQASSNTIYVGYPDDKVLFESQTVGNLTDRSFTQSEKRPSDISDSRKSAHQIVGKTTVSYRSKNNRVIDSASAPSHSQKFIPPDLDEAKAYFAEKGSTDIEAENFMDYYDSNGWMVGKNKMKAWKSAASRWIRQRAEWSQQKNPARPAEREYIEV